MTKLNKRLNLTIENDLYDEFKAIKELRNETSLSKEIPDLAKDALEISEDLYFAKISLGRLKEKMNFTY